MELKTEPINLKKIYFKKILFSMDSGALSLIFANLLTIIFALWQQWNFAVILWIYWAQSVTIGVINFFRILSLKKFSTENFKVNGQPVQPGNATKIKTAFFFAFHYGFFHLGYAVFLAAMVFAVLPFWKEIVGTSLLFMISSIVSFRNERKIKQKERNIGTMMAFPYARIIPMHLTIIFGFLLGSQLGMLFFMFLKTIADLAMHQYEHYLGLE